MNNERLGDILLKQGLIEAQQLDFCLSVQKNNGNQKLGRLFCHYDFVSEKAIVKAVAFQVGWEFFDGNYVVDERMLELFGIDFFSKYTVFPVKKNEGVIFVLSRTDDTSATDSINQTLGEKAVFALGMETVLRNALQKLSERYDNKGGVHSQSLIVEDTLNKWFENCLNQAVISLASDIHIEPSQKVVEIRCRLDGILVFIDTLPLKFLPRLVNIIFHMAEVTISDFNHFHDARFLHKYLNREIDVRVSHIPSIYGSSVVLRLLDKSKNVMALSDLGYGPKMCKLIEESLAKPNGISLVVGPTGCGKTTTLYAILNYLKSIENKILTIEDPVEIQLPLMTQVQVNEKRGVSFGQTVRAFLRHDPDIIFIGEIRDQLTAQEASRAAMTGHQVFSTLHTNRALDAILRLHDLGLPLTHISDHVSMIISQRLVRKLCPICKQKVKLDRQKSINNKYLNEPDQGVFVARGCPACNSGYKGQTVVAEVLLMDEEKGDLISRGDLVGFKKLYKDGNHFSMIDDARRLVSEGITSVEEAQRVLG